MALGLAVSDIYFFSCFLYISICKTSDLGRDHFSPHLHNLNKLFFLIYFLFYLKKLGRGTLGDDIKALVLMVSDIVKKIFSCFPYISLCKTYHPWGGPCLVPGV